MEKEKLKANLLNGSNILSFKCESNEEYSSFVTWLSDNGKFYNELLCEIPKNITVTNATGGNCYQNSQLVCINNSGIKYCEGIIIFRNGALYQHGFNLIGEEVLDVTYLNNIEVYGEDENNSPVQNYFGIVLDNKHFEDDERILKIPFLNNHLLYELFKQDIQKKPLD